MVQHICSTRLQQILSCKSQSSLFLLRKSPDSHSLYTNYITHNSHSHGVRRGNGFEFGKDPQESCAGSGHPTSIRVLHIQFQILRRFCNHVGFGFPCSLVSLRFLQLRRQLRKCFYSYCVLSFFCISLSYGCVLLSVFTVGGSVCVSVFFSVYCWIREVCVMHIIIYVIMLIMVI